MKKVVAFIAVSISLFLAGSTQAQSQSSVSAAATRPRSVMPPSADDAPPAPEIPVRAEPGPTEKAPLAAQQSSPAQMRTRIAEAQRLFKSRPRTTSLTPSALDVVTLALVDRSTSRLHLLSLSKKTFLTKNAKVALTTSLGTPVTLHVLR